MKSACASLGALLLLTGCAILGRVPGSLRAQVIVAGRIVSEEAASHFVGDVETVAHIYKLRPDLAPATEIEFYTEDSLCPSSPPGDQAYLVFLNKAATIFDIKTRRETSMLQASACAPVDGKTSSGLLLP
jgi:hypothetical protein